MHNAAYPELEFLFLLKFHLWKSKKDVERKGGPLFNRYFMYKQFGKTPKW